MTYAEAIEFLYGLRFFGTKLGLENTRQLAALAGNPQERLRFIHVAGTNGKGSTCAMLESIYRAAGWRVGLFTSPHLVTFSERLQVNRHLIAEGEVVRLVGEMRELLKHFPPEAHPTFFEVVTVMALRYFAEQACELVIWETGLGGRLDATNIVRPLASVITNIQLDHQQWLGETLENIAFEKAGIIKPGVPVTTAAVPGAGWEVIAQVAAQGESPLTTVGPGDLGRPPLDRARLSLRGEYQRFNAAVAVATVRALAGRLAVSESELVTGLEHVYWPGRLQWVSTPGRKILLDGAHNAAGAEALAAELRRGARMQPPFPDAPRYPNNGTQSPGWGSKPTLILGVMSDKDWHTMGAVLAREAGRMVLAPVKSQRALPPGELAPVCRQANAHAPVTVCASLAEAMEETARDPFVVVTGSLYLVGEAMEWLTLSTAPEEEERSLNEWNAAAR
jgi:dihydrofolate synthase/folylpolyglutamate synthase